jgi:ankyrin repeat protein
LAARTEVVRLLLDKGASVDEKDKDGSTALMKANE